MFFDPILQYCDKVCTMVRWQPYRAAITEELAAHMQDHADLLIAKGIPEEAAKNSAADAMGNPYDLGKELDRLHSPWYPRLSRIFAGVAVLLVLIATASGFTQDSTLFDRRFDPFAQTAALVLQGDASATGRTLLATGRTLLATGDARGGGKIGSYTFSTDGAAALFREESTYDGKTHTAYRVEVVFSSQSPCFWLGGFTGGNFPCALIQNGGVLADDGDLYTLPQQGIFRRFYRFSFYLDAPVTGPFTAALGEGAALGYDFTLREVSAP